MQLHLSSICHSVWCIGIVQATLIVIDTIIWTPTPRRVFGLIYLNECNKWVLGSARVARRALPHLRIYICILPISLDAFLLLHSPGCSVPHSSSFTWEDVSVYAPMKRTLLWWMVLLELRGIDKRQPHLSQGHQDWHSDNVLCEYIIECCHSGDEFINRWGCCNREGEEYVGGREILFLMRRRS